MIMKYKTNFVNHKTKGNSIKSGGTLNVSIVGAKVISGWVAKKTWYGKKLLQVDQGTNKLKFLLKPKSKFVSGKYILKVDCFDKSWKNYRWKDEFEVV